MREWEGNVERQKERESGSGDREPPHFPAGLTCSAPLFPSAFPALLLSSLPDSLCLDSAFPARFSDTGFHALEVAGIGLGGLVACVCAASTRAL